MSFTLLSDSSLLSEDIDDERIRILQKLQRGLANNLGLNVSLRSLMNFFLGYHLPSEDDQTIRTKFKELGYEFGKGYDINKHFWQPLLTQDEYMQLLPDAFNHREEEEQSPPDVLPDVEVEDEEERVRLGGLRNFIKRKAGDYLTQKVVNFDPPSKIEKLVRKAGYKPHELTRTEREIAELNMRSRLGIEDEEFSADITPHDYQEWARVIRAEAADRGANMNNKRSFEDIAFFVLDNDPKIDMIGNDEETKRDIVNMLWKQQRSAPATTASTEDEEASAVNSAENEGRAACMDHYHGVIRGMPKNPYAKGTRRYQQWERGFEEAELGQWTFVGKEDEEQNDQAPRSFSIPHEQDDHGYRKDGEPKGSAMPEETTKKFKLVWQDGKTEIVKGNNIADAFSKAGYGGGAIRALDYFKELKDSPPA